MKSFLTKAAIAAAATMITLSPALADKRHSYGSSHGYGYSDHKPGGYARYMKRKHARHFHGPRHHHHHWKPRFFSWKYAYKPNRW